MASKPPYPREAHIIKKEKGPVGKTKTVYDCVPTTPVPIPLSVNTTLSRKRWIPKSAMRMKAKARLQAVGPRVLLHRRFCTLSATANNDLSHWRKKINAISAAFMARPSSSS